MAGISTGSDPSGRRTPAVLVVLIVRDGAAWLRECLQALAAQTYRPLAVLAVDDASTDGSGELLEQALGSKRVLGLTEPQGIAGSVRAALELSAAREADYLLVLHDDTALDPDAIARLVEAANLEGVERVGVVGPKVVDWDNPRILREVGRSTDRFGHPYTPLQDGELDQGQFDRVLEVLFVSSIAMLVSQECLKRIGPPDERFASHHEDLDFCWRARLAGFRVLMTPLARARHMAATSRGRRRTEREGRSERYFGDRAALASMLKNYGLRSLLLLLPLYGVLGVGRLLWLLLSRRFEDAVELLEAWGWNALHLRGTLARRISAQKTRAVSDRSIRRFMESAGVRLPRWFDTASRILAEQRELEEEDAGEPVRRRLRHQGASFVRAHPVIVATFFGVVIAAVGFRGLFSPDLLVGGALPTFPAHPDGFFRELLSGVRTTGFGGTSPASPALGVLGGLSTLLFSSGALSQKAVLVGGGALGATFSYRALARQTGSPFAAVAGAGAYALSAVVLWAYSEGRVGLLVAVAVVPVLMDRLEVAFSADPPSNRTRFVVGLGLIIAVGVAFEPGLVPVSALLLVVQLVGGRRRGRGLGLAASGVAVGAALLFPILPGLAAGGGRALWSSIGPADMTRLARFVLGPAPGGALSAWFLPIAAVLALGVVRGSHRARANRHAMVGVAAVFLAWASAAGWLPMALSNAPAYTVLGACAAASVVGHGVASVLGVRSEAFGFRQMGAGALAVVLAGGIALQAMIAMVGGWAIGGPEKTPPAWAVVRSASGGDYRVLWLGADDGARLPAPAGDPQGILQNGESSLRYAVTGPSGATVLDLARASTGPADAELRTAVGEIVTGATRHGGALLAPLGVRYVVAAGGDLSPDVRARLDEQIDLDVQQASGLTIYSNARVLPVAGEIPVGGAAGLPPPASLVDEMQLPLLAPQELAHVTGGWEGMGPGGVVFVSSQYDPGWRLDGGGSSVQPRRAFGWAMSFDAPAGEVRVRYRNQWVRSLEITVLAALWAAALWVTRKPSAR
ncbi:MAG: glycosyltransferase family 2 protein [Actinobacteria bacterium]|nr:glycosyltransferase family 2 protein [Actinomycetota bacterium]